MTCSVQLCDRPAVARQLCGRHIQRFYKRGSAELPDQSIETRFLEKVDSTGSCWTWLAATAGSNYGVFRFEGRQQYAHRVSYVLFRGLIPEGLEIDHLCRNTRCVKPAHLEAVTPQENRRRGIGRSPESYRHAAPESMCLRGHVRAEHGYVSRLGRWVCRRCCADRQRARRVAA